jgi:glycosyltransferase involved in cell wall biosynthesis
MANEHAHRTVVAMVIDPWYHPFNGTVVSTRRFVDALAAQFDFKILLALAPDEALEANCMGFSRLRIPGINFIIDRMKAPLGLPNRQKLQQAMQEADLLHVQFPFFLGHGAIAEAKRQDKPVVMSFHVQPENILSNLGVSSRWLTDLLYRFFIWRFYDRADCVIAPSQFAADLLHEAGLAQPVTVLSNGVTEDFFLAHTPVYAPVHASVNETPMFHIVSVGRLAKEKQQPQLLRAIAASRFKNEIRLTLAGTGPQQGKLMDLAAELGVQAEIGRVSDERLKRLYQTADVFVQTSAVELEGMSVLEAMAAGCPVLINRSNTSAVPEFVVAPEATYAMNDVADLTHKLEAMLENPDLRSAAGQENRQIAQSRHHDHSVNALAQLYRRVLGEH